MFLELFHNAFIDSSFFYMYFGVILMTMGIMYFVHFHHNHPIVYDYVIGNKHQNMKIDISHLEKNFVINEPFILWLIMICKRIDEKDDKNDSVSSYFKKELKIRGGQLWKKMAYSQPLKNIDLSF
ncbi:hypothetical protein [Oceanobacillus timonensis]|uniref:hypothetical protein n=1 Tax=Oceanobacillus timonensis TaxID=1926285 RepID=UPI0009BB0394|nr:hypothetical protein [Oceanobacillus timonensis]